jgi:hypothetical protein
MDLRWTLVAFGGTPPLPAKAPNPPPPPPPLPPAAPPSETEGGDIVRREQGRTRRRFGVRQTILTGSGIGLTGDRPLGA